MVSSIQFLPSSKSSLLVGNSPIGQRCSAHHFEYFSTVLSVLIDDEGDVDGWGKWLGGMISHANPKSLPRIR